MENFKAERNPDNAPVPREELTALGIPENVSMKRGELNRRLATQKLRNAAGTTKADEEMFSGLTDEQIDRAEKAAKERWELGR